jgi:outer membrane receptor protein involved in Fe transport
MRVPGWQILAALCALAAIHSAEAQDDNSPDSTLPEVVVEPEDEGTLPPIDVSPDDDFSDFDDGDVMQFTYPSLADQFTGGLSDGLRGPEMSLFDNPQAIDIVTQQDIVERGPSDMGALLEQTVGVMVQRTGRGQSSPYVRGLTGQQVLVLVDGVRLTMGTYRAGPNQYFNTIDPNMVERIEVIRGSGAVLYGADALGGVINVVTKSSKLCGFDYATGSMVHRFSSADTGYTGRLNVEGSVGSMGVFAGGGYGNYNNLNIGSGADFPAGVSDPQLSTSWGYDSGDIKFNYALSDCSELIFSLQHYSGNDIFRSDRNPANRVEIFDPQLRDLAYLRWQGCTDGLISTYQITGSFHQLKEDRVDDEFGRVPPRVRTFGYADQQTGLTFAFGTDMCDYGWLTYGFDWYHDQIHDSTATTNGAPATPPYPDDAYYSRYAPYVNWDVWMTDHWLLSAGTRFEHITTGATPAPTGANPNPTMADLEFDGWIGQIGTTVVLTDQLHWVANINQGFRAPNLDDLFATGTSVFATAQDPNPTLDPERSITYETGFKYNDCSLRAEVYAWWTDIDDAIVRQIDPNTNVLSYLNSQTYLQGIEFNGEYLLDCNWSVYGNCWYVYAQDTEFDEPLSKIPPLQGIVGLRWRSDYGCNWFDVFTWLVDEQDRLSAADIGDTRRIPPGGTPGYGTLNVRAGHMISDCQRISIVGENLTDEFYRVHGSGSAGAGINAIVSYELLR